MKKVSLAVMAAAAALLLTSTPARSEINVNIGINVPPAIVVSSPPSVIVIPGTYVYFAPDIDAEVFFYGGWWWRPHAGRWHRAAEFGDPWVVIEIGRVPGVLLKLPPDYRRVPPGHQKIPYGQLKKNWRKWEKERRWDKRAKAGKSRPIDDRGEHGGHGKGKHD